MSKSFDQLFAHLYIWSPVCSKSHSIQSSVNLFLGFRSICLKNPMFSHSNITVAPMPPFPTQCNPFIIPSFSHIQSPPTLLIRSFSPFLPGRFRHHSEAVLPVRVLAAQAVLRREGVCGGARWGRGGQPAPALRPRQARGPGHAHSKHQQQVRQHSRHVDEMRLL